MTTLVQAVETWAIERLIPYATNAHTHDDLQVSQIAASIVEFGFVNPILVGDDDVVVAGHGRLMAAKNLNLKTVPVIILGHLSETQRRALVIADNKIAENSGWDDDLLKQELNDLQGLDFDLDILGFSEQELDDLMFETDEHEDDSDSIGEPPENPVSQTGDVWLLGDHRLMCGDATDGAQVSKLMAGQLADMTFTDPPYNVDYQGGNRDRMRGKSRRILNDNLGSDFQSFLKLALSNILSVTKGACYIAMSSSELDVLQRAFRESGGKWSTFIVWAKNHFTLGSSDYQRQYETLLYGWRDGNDHFWCGDRTQSDIWYVDKPQRNDLHPTMKPIALVEKAIRNSSKTQDIVLDLFGGSGTTIIACEKSTRSARMMELDPQYVDVIIKRWQEWTGEVAIRESDQALFDNLSAHDDTFQ